MLQAGFQQGRALIVVAMNAVTNKVVSILGGMVTLSVHAADTRGTAYDSARISICPRTEGKMDPEHLAKRIRSAIRDLA